MHPAADEDIGQQRVQRRGHELTDDQGPDAAQPECGRDGRQRAEHVRRQAEVGEPPEVEFLLVGDRADVHQAADDEYGRQHLEDRFQFARLVELRRPRSRCRQQRREREATQHQHGESRRGGFLECLLACNQCLRHARARDGLERADGVAREAHETEHLRAQQSSQRDRADDAEQRPDRVRGADPDAGAHHPRLDGSLLRECEARQFPEGVQGRRGRPAIRRA